MPREISRMIATIPGVGMALEALLPIMGGVFAVGMIYKWVEESEKAAADVQAAWDKSANTTRDIFDKLGDKLLGVGIKADELAGDHLAALNKQIQLIDRQTMSGIITELDKMGKEADDVFTKMQSNWFMQLMMGSADVAPVRAKLQGVIEDIDKLKNSGADPGKIRDLLGVDLDKAKNDVDAIEAKMKVLRAARDTDSDAEGISGDDAQLNKLQKQKEVAQQLADKLQEMHAASAMGAEVGTGERKTRAPKRPRRMKRRVKPS